MDAPDLPAKPSKDTRLLDPDTGEPYVDSRGRKYGQVDLIDGGIREQVAEALRVLGGPNYFVALGLSDTPSDRGIFGQLVGKCMPTEVKGNIAMGVTVELVSYAQQAIQQAHDVARTVEMARPAAASALLD